MLINIIISIISIIIVYILMRPKTKYLEKIALDENLNKISEKYPNNIKICKSMLEMLENENVQLEENLKSESTMYIIVTNKIFIGNTHNSFSRIQTMAHECLHSVQSKKLLWFNFIYSNIYILYFFIISGLVIFKKTSNEIIFSNILLILGFVHYVVKMYLENDAMVKAEFIAKDYIQKSKISSEEENKKLIKGFKEINKYGIRGTNYSVFSNIMIKVILFNLLALIF